MLNLKVLKFTKPSSPTTDEYFLLEDFAAYVEAQEKIDALYRDHDKWARYELS